MDLSYRSGRQTRCVAAVLVASLSAPALALPVHRDCPGTNTKMAWPRYMSGVLPRKDNMVSAVASVQFRWAKAYGDKEALGGVPTNRCYLTRFMPKVGYKSSNGSRTLDGLPGNPLEYEVNVMGTIFLFDDAGRVYDRKGRVVGLLVCDIHPHKCASY